MQHLSRLSNIKLLRYPFKIPSQLVCATRHSGIAVSPGSKREITTKPAYEGHIPLNWFESTFLAAGSAVMALADPRRGDMIAALGETTAGPSLSRLRDIMLEDPEGRGILKDRPRVNSQTVDMDELAQYPEGTFGRAYVTWLERCGVTPDTREPVHYIDDPELAYVMQRYRECHDFYHCICNLPVNVESELALKHFEFANLGLPMTAISAIFGPLRLTHRKRERLYSEFVPWALKCGGTAKSLITVYWERRWDQNVEDIKRELGIWDPPEARWSKPLSEAKAAATKRQQKSVVSAQGQN
ncbi:ubiquinone biosynthesis protein COQ4, mitochondrial [Macrolepiota fuliginosa MF-IS2]|uniref:4-hydroxy-3-methoxy-5-polyprenylbenzoate decarboxylase n=1 Tax=Macrolepiota fuliginosa MF-IS2 TaxID=1400762 RepID=A0A9P5X4Q8_9AGAR|nr:ubiquinone biosynthesis protein COQ4, mitochondrial [Macrolepiota fuliginosa MF-IS2]